MGSEIVSSLPVTLRFLLRNFLLLSTQLSPPLSRTTFIPARYGKEFRHRQCDVPTILQIEGYGRKSERIPRISNPIICKKFAKNKSIPAQRSKLQQCIVRRKAFKMINSFELTLSYQ
jgi:hypothetical protein